MFGPYFYHHTLKKVTASFGTLFNDISVIHRNKQGQEVERIKVPITYGPRDKMRVRVLEDPELQRGFAIKLPRMSFQITTVQYDAQRKINTIRVNTKAIENNQKHVDRQYNGVPYKVGFELNILSKNVDDANQIVEQIFPWFTPAYTITINSIPDMKLTDDVVFVLEGIDLQDNYTDDWKERRDVLWVLSFSAKIMFYGPVREKDVITKVQTDFYCPLGSLENSQNLTQTPREHRHTVVPVFGSSTYEDPFEYSETWEFFRDNKKYNPETGQDEDVVLKIKPNQSIVGGRFGKPKLI